MVSKADLIARYPELKSRIELGDFFIKNGPKAVVWANTAVFFPNLSQLKTIIEREFPGVPGERLSVKADLMSLVVKEI